MATRNGDSAWRPRSVRSCGISGAGDLKPNYTRTGTGLPRTEELRADAPLRPIIDRMGLLPVYRAADMRRIEASAGAQPLMERAGAAATDVARILGDRDKSVLVLAGPGNNGGDAFVVARRLREALFHVDVIFCGDPASLPQDAADAYRFLIQTGGRTVPDFPAQWHGSLIVDGLFGIGLARPLADPYASLVERANASGAPILALDVPSGLDGDTGVAQGVAIRAAATATFIALKPGLLTGEGLDYCGDVSIHSLGYRT